MKRKDAVQLDSKVPTTGPGLAAGDEGTLVLYEDDGAVSVELVSTSAADGGVQVTTRSRWTQWLACRSHWLVARAAESGEYLAHVSVEGDPGDYFTLSGACEYTRRFTIPGVGEASDVVFELYALQTNSLQAIRSGKAAPDYRSGPVRLENPTAPEEAPTTSPADTFEQQITNSINAGLSAVFSPVVKWGAGLGGAYLLWKAREPISGVFTDAVSYLDKQLG